MKKLILLCILLAMFGFAFADTVTVGTGTATSSNLPIVGLYGYTYSQQIYTQAQINATGNITKIRFYYVSGTIATSKDWVVYLGHTTKTTFASTTDWEPYANLTPVYAGDVTSLVPLANNWMEITLTTAFPYDNVRNLIVAVDENTAGYASMSWGAFTSGANTGIYYRSDTVNPDPTAPPTAYAMTNSINRMQFVFPNTAAPLPVVLVGPSDGGWAFTSETLNWANGVGGGDPTSYDVYFGNPLAFVGNQPGRSYAPVMAPGNTYYWRIDPVNEFGPTTGTVWSLKTPTATQLAESFENVTFPPTGWANPGTWSRSTSYFKHGLASAYKYVSTTTTAYVLSGPKVTMTATSTLNFWSSASSITAQLQVVYSPDRVNWTPIGANITHAATNTMYETTRDLSSLAGNNYYIGFQTPIQAGYPSLYIDRVFGPEITPEAPGPVTLVAPLDLVGDQNPLQTFTWTAPTTGGAPLGYKVYCGLATDPTDLLATVTGLTYTCTVPLAYNQLYYWKVVATNGTGDSAPNVVRSFTTWADQTVLTFPWTESFDGTTFAPLGWNNIKTAGTGIPGIWDRQTAGTSPTCDPHSGVGTGMARYNAYSLSGGTIGQLITPPLDVPNAMPYRVKFWMYRDSGYSTYNLEVLNVYLNETPSSVGGTLMRTVSRYYGFAPVETVANAWYQYEFNFTGSVANKYVVFEAVSQFGNNFFIDDILVEEVPPAPVMTVAPLSWDFGTKTINTLNTKEFTITNTGGGNLGITSISIAGTYYSLSVNPAPITLGPGVSANFTVQYAPLAEGTHTGTVTITNDLARQTLDIPLTAACVDPTIAIFPYDMGFEDAWVGTPPAPAVGWTVIDANTDGYTWRQGATYISAHGGLWFAQGMGNTNDWMITPPIDASVNLRLKWWDAVESASYPNSYRVMVSTTDNNIGSFTQIADFTCSSTTWTEHTLNLDVYTGNIIYLAFYQYASGSTYWDFGIDDLRLEEIPANPIMSVVPTSWDFGTTTVGSLVTKEFTITNIGAGTLGITNIGISGTYYSLTVNPAPISLGAGVSTSFTVQYAPLAVGTHTGTVSITNDLARAVVDIPLTGAAALMVNMNNGTTTLNVGESYGFYDSGGPAAPYLASEIYTHTFVPPALWRIKSVFSTFDTESGYDFLSVYDGPTTADPLLGTYSGLAVIPDFVSSHVSGALTFHFISDGSVQNAGWAAQIVLDPVPVTPILTYSPSSINFGTNYPGVPSASTNVVVGNAGVGTLNLLAGDVSLIGTDAAEFQFDPINLPAALAFGETVNIPVWLNALTPGAKTATLRITYNGARPDYDVALSALVLATGQLVQDYEGTLFPPNWWSVTETTWMHTITGTHNAQLIIAGLKSSACGQFLGDPEAMMITPKLDLDGTVNYLNFKTKGMNNLTGYGETTLQVKYQLDGTGTWTAIGSPITYLDINATIQDISIDLSGLPLGVYKFAFTATSTFNYAGYFSWTVVDDVIGPKIYAVADRPDPVTLTYPADLAVDLPRAGFNFTWTPAGTAGTPDGYYISIADDETRLFTVDELYNATALLPSHNAVANGFVFDYSATYFWAVKAYNTYGQSPMSTVFSFTVQAPPIVVSVFPWSEDFELHGDNTVPENWARSSLGVGWVINSENSSTYWTIPVHTVYASANDDGGGSANDGSMDLLSTIGFDFLSGGYVGFPVLSFDSFYTGAYSQLAYIEATTNGVLWTNIYNVAANTAWVNVSVPLNAYSGLPYVGLRFHADDAGAWASGWAIDNVAINYVNTDLLPPTITTLPLLNSPRSDIPYPVYADIADDITWNNPIASATLYYSINLGPYTPVAMTVTTAPEYTADIPAQALNSQVDYYITAEDSEGNLATSATYTFYVENPTWLWYDSGTISTYLGSSTVAWATLQIYENPFFGTATPMQVLSTDGSSYYAATGNLQVYSFDGTSLTPLITPVACTFGAQTYEVFDVSALNIQVTTQYFAVSYEFALGNYVALDQTRYYGTAYYIETATSSIYELGAIGFAGVWLTGAQVTNVSVALDAPVVTIAQTAGLVTLSWAAITGANSYLVYGADEAYAADPWTLLTTTALLTYDYTGTENFKFFKVVASSAARTARTAVAITERVIPLSLSTAKSQAEHAPKTKVKSLRK